MNQLFNWSRPVEFSETDYAGVVHFSNFFRWVEAAEHAFLESMGLPIVDGGVGWPRVHASADFRAPVKFGDTVKVKLELTKKGESSLHYRFEIRVNESHEICARGEMSTVCLDRQTRKATGIPGGILEG